MARRYTEKQSKHDGAVRAAKQIYNQNDIHAWINPGSQKNKSWRGKYIDVIAAEKRTSNSAWVIEVETADSVSSSEADSQWSDYDATFDNWYLAVPESVEQEAKNLKSRYSLSDCTVITWTQNSDGTHTFWGLPGT